MCSAIQLAISDIIRTIGIGIALGLAPALFLVMVMWGERRLDRRDTD